MDLVVSFRAVSSLFSPSFFSSALEPNEISLEIQIRERDIYTRETQASISRVKSLSLARACARVQKKKEAARTFFILDLRFHVVDRVRRLHLERDRLPGQRFHENLHCVLLLLLFSSLARA